jgi:hypothetical protein
MAGPSEPPPLQVISGDATPEEVAAITAAIAAVTAEREAVARAAVPATPPGDHLNAWVRASRLTARRSGLMRGPWRLSGRIGRRARA